MFDWNMLTTLKQIQAENPTLFPFPLGLHVVFSVLALIFFIFRFFTDKKPFQLIFAIAIPFSLTLWISDSRTWFYTVGAIELVFIVCAFLSTFFSKKNESEAETASTGNAEEASAESESENKSEDASDATASEDKKDSKKGDE